MAACTVEVSQTRKIQVTAVASFLCFDINTGNLLVPFDISSFPFIFLDTDKPFVRHTGIFPGLRVTCSDITQVQNGLSHITSFTPYDIGVFLLVSQLKAINVS